MGYNLFLDDKRSLDQAHAMTGDDIYINKQWAIVRNYDEFVYYITEMFEAGYFIDLVSFDHDLGLEHIEYYFNNGGHENPPDPLKAQFKEKSGYDCAKWLTEFCLSNKLKLPEYRVHSANPIGRRNIISYLDNYKKHCE